MTPLIIQAARKGKREVIEQLLAQGEDIESKSTHSDTPLIIAAKYNNEEAANTLLANGSDPLAINYFGNNAMTFAVFHSNPNMVIELLIRGIDINEIFKRAERIENDTVLFQNLSLAEEIENRKNQLSKRNREIWNKVRVKSLFQ